MGLVIRCHRDRALEIQDQIRFIEIAGDSSFAQRFAAATAFPDLSALLPLAAADIQLTDSGLIVPFKSASGLIGVGPGYRETTMGAICGLCRLKDGCWRQKD